MSKVNIYIPDNEIKKIEKRLRRLSRTNRSKTKEIIQDAGIKIAGDTKEDSDIKVDTGRLRASIHSETESNTSHTYKDNTGKSYNGALGLRPGELEAFVGTNVHYQQKHVKELLIKNYKANKDNIIRALVKAYKL